MKITIPKRFDDKSKYRNVLFCMITAEISDAVGSDILLLAKFNLIKQEFLSKALAK